ncbi:Hypothetical protein NTJ_06489 [Nesidiocoris tenuis]|uniref:Uncharacterized protein n=1 Tax=Nesidiocoris tenuis TaxID=355587 RepID=A0ABN7AN79_9HEMI|nr:Hypothetical protein NTJ_06489 [Nesidiocoris tenuis]
MCKLDSRNCAGFTVGKKMMYFPNYPRIMERNSREIRDYYYLRTRDPEFNKVYELKRPMKWTDRSHY